MFFRFGMFASVIFALLTLYAFFDQLEPQVGFVFVPVTFVCLGVCLLFLSTLVSPFDDALDVLGKRIDAGLSQGEKTACVFATFFVIVAGWAIGLVSVAIVACMLFFHWIWKGQLPVWAY